MKRIGLIGYSGYFGKVITENLIKDFPDCEFILLGRKKTSFLNSNVEFHYFDYNIHDSIDYKKDLSIIIDLSGPIKRDDGKSARIAAKSKIPYMDMAIHNSHLSIVSEIYNEYPESTLLAHFGFFPGISNLLISRGFELAGKKSGILINEFPVYAGGGKNVSISLSDLLEESRNHVNIKDYKLSSFRMHSKVKKFKANKGTKQFYQWEYSEIPSFIRSDAEIISLERYFSLKPSFLNPVFNVISFLWNSPMSPVLKAIIPFMARITKGSIFYHLDPAIKMSFWEISASVSLIDLRVKSAVSFHGQAMSSFLRAFLNRKIGPGLYTPEQIFKLEEILQPGDHKNYSLSFMDR